MPEQVSVPSIKLLLAEAVGGDDVAYGAVRDQSSERDLRIAIRSLAEATTLLRLGPEPSWEAMSDEARQVVDELHPGEEVPLIYVEAVLRLVYGFTASVERLEGTRLFDAAATLVAWQLAALEGASGANPHEVRADVIRRAETIVDRLVGAAEQGPTNE